MADDKKDLILSLAGAMGMSGRNEIGSGCYDKTTGTMYCGSHVYHSQDIYAAKQYLKKRYERLKSMGDGTCHFYEVALSSIELMEKEYLLSNGGKLVVRNEMTA